jgi:curved DNA-binding protein CbpA
MDKIIVDGETYNPYFMLDVVPDDTENFITKSFRKKAKMWHPDKIKSNNPEIIRQAQIHFKVLVESYEYIINNKRSFNHSKKREHIDIINNSNLNPKSIDNTSELDLFNEEFKRLNVTSPNDFGYEIKERLTDIKQYDNFNYRPHKIFDPKQFNRSDFNKVFEYQQQLYNNSNESNDISLYHKTTDGFNGYNSGELGNTANVSSYNGVMIVGDTYGQTGMGYYDTQYSDYKKSFDVAKNPETDIVIPETFKSYTNQKIKPLSKSETSKQIELQMQHRNNLYESNNPSYSKHDFKLQEQILLDKQSLELQQKLEQDKRMMLQFQHMYGDQSLIQAALDNRLVTSTDYVNEDSINKRFLKTNI